MTVPEFMAWFDGFNEAVGDTPTPEQWAKVKAKVEALAAPVQRTKSISQMIREAERVA